MRSLVFTLPLLLPSLNRTKGEHWGASYARHKLLHQEVMAAVRGPRHYPLPPFARARLLITRYTCQLTDDDNRAGSVKQLVDVLKANHPTRNPLGLSFIAGDESDKCEIIATQERVHTRAQQCTLVVIHELPDLPPEPPKKRRTRRKE
jgi:hypothetical protein